MRVKIDIFHDLPQSKFELILTNQLEGGYSLDYALNALVSHYDGKEIILFDFTKYFVIDNRKSGYEIEETGDAIIIHFK